MWFQQGMKYEGCSKGLTRSTLWSKMLNYSPVCLKLSLQSTHGADGIYVTPLRPNINKYCPRPNKEIKEFPTPKKNTKRFNRRPLRTPCYTTDPNTPFPHHKFHIGRAFQMTSWAVCKVFYWEYLKCPGLLPLVRNIFSLESQGSAQQ